jgi:hypothetical protein
MATNLIQKEGREIQLAVAGKSSGDPVLKGTITGVCLTDTDASGNVVVDLGGIYDLSVKAVDDSGNSGVAIGDKIFYVAADTPKLSKKASGYFFGYALEVITSGATDTINVLQIPGPGPGTLDLLAGAIGTAALADKAVTLAKMNDMATASLIYRKTASAGAPEVNSLATLKTDLGLTGTNSGDQTITMSGNVTGTGTGAITTTIAAGAVTAAMLANGAGVAALLTAGLGGSATGTKAETTTKTIVAAHGTKDRACLVVAVVTEAFATGDTSRTLIKVGETDTLDKMWGNSNFPNAMALGTVIVGAFTNTATKAITLDITAAAGTGTGGVAVWVISIPTT